MPGVVVERAAPGPAELPRRLGRFLLLAAQLAGLLLAFWLYHVEEAVFFSLFGVAAAGFCIHFWLPARFQEGFFAALSAGCAFLVLEPWAAAAVLGTLLAVYAVVRSPLPYRARLVLALGLLGLVALARSGWSAAGPVPTAARTFAGTILMFRLLVYLYDLRHLSSPPRFLDFATYFCQLPNWCFLFYPVVDYQTMRRSFRARDHAEVAQQGIVWIVRGTLQLLLYRLVVELKGGGTPDEVTSFLGLVETMVLTYLLYLRVSGTFHIIVGMLHLFGYDLPETHRRWLAARSLTDFWRRINIYWKDFMVKLVYFPVFFRLRRRGNLQAQLVATALVFVATWALHVCQTWWITDRLLLTAPDVLFWGTLGALVMVNVALEARRPPAAQAARPAGLVGVGLRIAATLALIVCLWSLWSSPSLATWLDLLTWQRIG